MLNTRAGCRPIITRDLFLELKSGRANREFKSTRRVPNLKGKMASGGIGKRVPSISGRYRSWIWHILSINAG